MSAPTLTQPLIIDQGALFRLVVEWRDQDGSPIPLTGYSACAHLRATHASPQIVLAFSSSDGTALIEAAAGRITLAASAAITRALQAPSTGVWDLEVESPTGDVTRLLQGRYSITPEVTR